MLGAASWHHHFRESAYIFIGGLDYGFNEGDIITIFSQFGEVVDGTRTKNAGTVRNMCAIVARTGHSRGGVEYQGVMLYVPRSIMSPVAT